MRKLAWLFILAAVTCLLAIAGDWLGVGGDPQHTAWQRYGKHLTAANVKDLKLLWKRRIEGPFATPIILGPTVTHRGVRELLFLGTSPDNFFAIDADLNTVFWKKQFDAPARVETCGAGRPFVAVIETDPEEDMPGEAVSAEDDDDDEPGNMRPLYAVSADGRLRTIRPSDGTETANPIDFLPPGAVLTGLNFADGVVYAATSRGCHGEPAGVWAQDVGTTHSKTAVFPIEGQGVASGVSIGIDGGIYSAIDDRIVSLSPKTLRLKASFLAPEPVSIPPVLFKWQGRELLAAGGKQGLFVLDADLKKVTADNDPRGEFTGSLATWQEFSGARWIYAAAVNRIIAFKVTGTRAKPQLQRVWSSQELASPGPPAITNGMVFTVTGGPAHATLMVLDAATGKQLYSSAEAVTSIARTPPVVLANGHACFGTSDNTLYCFGIPVE